MYRVAKLTGTPIVSLKKYEDLMCEVFDNAITFICP